MFGEFLNELIYDLSNDSRFTDISFLSEFTIANKPHPIKHPLVAVGINGVKIQNGAIGDYLGFKSGGELHGKKSEVSVKLSICTSCNQGGETCYEVFSLLSDFLLFDRGTTKAFNLNSGEIKYDSTISGFVLDCIAVFNIYIGNTVQEGNISDIIVKGVI